VWLHSLSRRYPPPLLTKTAGHHNKKGQDTSKDLRAEPRYPPVTPKPQPLRINDTKNPPAVSEKRLLRTEEGAYKSAANDSIKVGAK